MPNEELMPAPFEPLTPEEMTELEVEGADYPTVVKAVAELKHNRTQVELLSVLLRSRTHEQAEAEKLSREREHGRIVAEGKLAVALASLENLRREAMERGVQYEEMVEAERLKVQALQARVDELVKSLSSEAPAGGQPLPFQWKNVLSHAAEVLQDRENAYWEEHKRLTGDEIGNRDVELETFMRRNMSKITAILYMLSDAALEKIREHSPLLADELAKLDNSIPLSVARLTVKGAKNLLKIYVLMRNEDESGVSGTGVVADVVEFPSGWVAVGWRASEKAPKPAVYIYPDISYVKDIHGHGGKTRIVPICDTGSMSDVIDAATQLNKKLKDAEKENVKIHKRLLEMDNHYNTGVLGWLFNFKGQR